MCNKLNAIRRSWKTDVAYECFKRNIDKYSDGTVEFMTKRTEEIKRSYELHSF